MGVTMLQARGLSCAPRLSGVDLAVHGGEMLGVIGPNGAGKSTLLQCLAGLLPSQGELDVEGRPMAGLALRWRGQSIGFMPQFCDSAWALRVADLVALGRLPWGDEDGAAIAAAMQRAGVSQWADRRVDTLSGGEQARVWLARVLAGEPRLLLADEPIASLDLYHQRSVMDILRARADAGLGVILAIHDLALAARYCDRLCLIDGGRVRAVGRPAQVLTEPLLSEVFRVPVRVDLSAEPPVVSVR